ncbi:MAG: hypothetical protein ACLUUO_07915 [Sellimonas intestinalis]
MTCCEEDITFLGYLCRYKEEFPYQNRDWVFVTVSFRYEYMKQYKEKGPVLYLEEMIPAKNRSTMWSHLTKKGDRIRRRRDVLPRLLPSSVGFSSSRCR